MRPKEKQAVHKKDLSLIHILYILRIVKNGDEEEFVAVDEDMMEELIDVVERIFEDELEGEEE